MTPNFLYWSWVPETQILCHEWDDEIVIFNQLTQDTHLLSKPVDWILNELKARPLVFEALAMMAMEENIISDNDDGRKTLHDALVRLESLDLLESS